MTALGRFGFEVASASDFCRIGQSCNLRNCPQPFRREGSYDRYLRMDDYYRRKDDSYFDRYRDSFDGRGPRAKGEVPAVCSHFWERVIGGHYHLHTKGLVTQWGNPQMLMLMFKCKLAPSSRLVIPQEMRKSRWWQVKALRLTCRFTCFVDKQSFVWCGVLYVSVILTLLTASLLSRGKQASVLLFTTYISQLCHQNCSYCFLLSS